MPVGPDPKPVERALQLAVKNPSSAQRHLPARPPGTRNPGFDDMRHELAKRVAERAVAPDGRSASLRELARSAEVSVPICHYFGDREGALAAAFVALGQEGQ